MRCHTRHLWLPPLRPSFLELRRIVWENILTAGGKKNHVFTEFANREIFVGLSHMFCFFWQKQKAVFFATKTAFRFRQCFTSIFAKQKAVFPGENSSSWNKREALFVKNFPFWRQKSLHSMQMSPGGLHRKEGNGRAAGDDTHWYECI